MRIFSQYFLSLIFFLALMELGLHSTSRLNPWTPIENIVRPTKIEKKNRDEHKSIAKKMEYRVKRNLTSINFQPKIPHPYFGHVYNRSKDVRVNRDGFLDTVDFYQIKSNSPDKYYIGIFGGSVAKEFALRQIWKQRHKSKGLAAKLKEQLPDVIGEKEIIILNFAVSAHKQPQQFIISSFYSQKLDMAITIDGYNEIAHPFGETFKADFPSYSNLFYSLNPRRNKYIEGLYDLMAQRIDLASFFNKNMYLKRSYTIGWIWNFYDRWLNYKTRQIHQKFEAKEDKIFPFYSSYEELSLEQKASELAGIWQEFSWKQHVILSASNVLDFYFIQPNQHIKASKKLSKEEIDQFYDLNRVEWLQLGYETLITKANELKKRKVPVFDLTKIFSEVDKTVYRDSCCHLNSFGRDLMEIKISEIIIGHISKNFTSNER